MPNKYLYSCLINAVTSFLPRKESLKSGYRESWQQQVLLNEVRIKKNVLQKILGFLFIVGDMSESNILWIRVVLKNEIIFLCSKCICRQSDSSACPILHLGRKGGGFQRYLKITDPAAICGAGQKVLIH